MAEMVHARGKYLFIHACGHLKALAPHFLESGVDCVEGQAPPPLGDWTLHEAKALSEELIICGGMAAPEQELRGVDTHDKLDTYVRHLFSSMGNKKRFLFGSSCNTSPTTPFENLLFFREAAWKYGKFNNKS
jgi:uroporphyrinogen-III decarboxylase